MFIVSEPAILGRNKRLRNTGIAARTNDVLPRWLLVALACLPLPQFANAQPSHSPAIDAAPLTAEQVVQGLVWMNWKRTKAPRGYEGTRTYRLNYHGFPRNSRAEMIVKIKYRAPATKDFVVISQTGSRAIVDRVFKRLLAAEKEALTPENARRTALDPANYRFTLLDYKKRPTDSIYMLSVQARSNNKFSYRGQIWVDATDFAVVRIKAEPAKNPSFWIKHTDIEHAYSKIGDFWLPSSDRSVSQVRLGGNADLTIEYNDYKITDSTPLKR